jgi:hypothetical protein
MRRTDLIVVAIGALMACGGSPTSCPEGTKETFNDGRDGTRRRLCVLEDGVTVHGPVVDITKDGRERFVGRSVRGKREGKWIQSDPLVGSTEAVYKDGKLDGRLVIRDLDGKKIGEQEFRMGQRHGMNTTWNADGTVTRQEHYEDGLPARTWEVRMKGDVETRTYGSDGVLLSINGRAVPAPPGRLELPDGNALERTECVRRARAFRWEELRRSPESPCLDVFEQVQLCSDDACRRRAIEELMKRQ